LAIFPDRFHPDWPDLDSVLPVGWVVWLAKPPASLSGLAPAAAIFSDALQCNHGITARWNLLLEFAVPER